MRTKVVKIADKEIIVAEKRIKDFKKLSNDLSVSFKEIINIDVEGKTTDDDIDNAYPSEIENLIGAFIEVNFTGVKKVITPAMKSALMN